MLIAEEAAALVGSAGRLGPVEQMGELTSEDFGGLGFVLIEGLT